MDLTGNVSGMLHLLGGGDNVTITQVVTSGTKIASITLNEGTPEEETIDLYSPNVVVNYNDLQNIPSINGNQLIGNKTSSQLGLFSGSYNDLTDKPQLPQILNGTSVPGSAIGNNGDLYIHYAGSVSSYTEYEITPLPSFTDRSYTAISLNDLTYDAIRVVGGGLFGSYDTTITKDNIPTYDGEDAGKNNIWNYNWANQVGVSKDSNNIYIWKYGNTTISNIYISLIK